MDREKVINALETCKTGHLHRKADKYVVSLDVRFVNTILELLKEQDAVEPHYNPRTNWYECGACHYSMTSGMHCRSELIPAYKVGFCAKCGKAVKWE